MSLLRTTRQAKISTNSQALSFLNWKWLIRFRFVMMDFPQMSGMNEGIDFDTKTVVAIYNLMPQKIKDLCISSYEDIAPRIEKSGKGFSYEGVTITPIRTANGTDLKFSCHGYSLVVKNYTKAEFDKIFGL